MVLGEMEFRDGWSSSGNGSLLVDSVDLWSLWMPDVLQTHTPQPAFAVRDRCLH